MALLNSLLLLVCALMAAGQAITGSPLEGHAQNSSPGHRHLLATVPGRPSIANVGTVGAAAFLYVDVAPPSSNGGSSITAYEIIGTPDGGPTPSKPVLQAKGIGVLTTGVINLRFTFSSYPRGVPYRFTVRARNQAGLGPASTPPTAFATPKQSVPGPPVVTLSRLPDGLYFEVTPPPHVLPLTYTLVGHPDGGATTARPRIVITGTGSLVPGQPSTGSGSSSPSQQLGRPGGTRPTQLKRRFRVTGYLPNTVYRFAASAANSAGAGPENVPRTVFYVCSNGFRDTGAGCQCPAIANCETYAKGICACSKCKQYFTTASSGSSCKCTIDRTNCKTVARDGCSCQACKPGWTADGSGGCTQITCAPLANCKTYSQVDCKCTRCNSGWGNCDGKDNTGCETPLNSTAHCGSCTAKCTLANATPRCDGGTCTIASCLPGWGDCDQKPANGCETALNTTERCGGCTTKCSLANATPRCDRGTCSIASCAPGWGDCDLKPSNGCETALNTTERCGSCTNKCSLLRATATCVGGTCRVASCGAGWGNCDGRDDTGCETALTTVLRCGSCNTRCNLPRATAACDGGVCKVTTCDAGWGDCDLDPSNGCETRLNTTTNCGACNTTCARDNATPICGSGTCSIATCAAGWGDCDLDPSNGCETRLNTTTNCGACNTTCARDNATPTCGSGTCSIDTCAAGWGDCDLDPSNGCETDLTTPQHCGSCLNVCTTAQICLNGTCVVNAMAAAWGWNLIGQLGDGTVSDSVSTPVTVAGNLRFKQVDAGWEHTCGITPAGQAYCWGDNSEGQLGNNTVDESYTPVSVSGGLRFTQISAGEEHTCGIDTAGQAWCWGCAGEIGTYYGQVGAGTGFGSDTPVRVFGNLQFTQISTRAYHTCGIDTTGQAYCWGDNTYYQLGNNTVDVTDTPVSVSGGLRFTQISTGEEHTCGIDTAGQAWCWGDNFFDQLGNAAVFSDSDTPIRVEGELRFKQISAGDYHTCGITASDRAVCWGSNYEGQLGDGTNTDSQTPVSVSADMLFQQISVGEVHTCALNITGHALCWGGNLFGALGDGTQDFLSSNTPVSVAGGKLFTQISVADYHAVAVVRSSG